MIKPTDHCVVMSMPALTSQSYKDTYFDLIRFYREFSTIVAKYHDVIILSDGTSETVFRSLGSVENNISFIICDPPDIWIRDWFPIRTRSGLLVKAIYRPRYLSRRRAIEIDTWVSEIIRPDANVDLVIDGGNFVPSPDRTSAIMTTRVFSDNPAIPRDKITETICQMFELDHLIVIPEESGLWCGHADGMVNWLTDNVIVINRYTSKFKNELKMSLQSQIPLSIDIVQINYKASTNITNDFQPATGVYVNLLKTGSLCVVPSFDNPLMDHSAFELIAKRTPVPVYNINALSVSCHGGVINCVSWN